MTLIILLLTGFHCLPVDFKEIKLKLSIPVLIRGDLTGSFFSEDLDENPVGVH